MDLDAVAKVRRQECLKLNIKGTTVASWPDLFS
jgi:hypothetical protein